MTEAISSPSGSPPGPELQAPVKPGDTLSGTTTIDQLIAALYQTNTLGTPVSYVWLEAGYLAITYSHQSAIYMRLAAKADSAHVIKLQ